MSIFRLVKALFIIAQKIFLKLKSLFQENPIIGLIFIAGLLFRVWGVYPGYPYYHPDEGQVYSRALLIMQGRESDFSFFGYPSLVPLIHAFFYLVFFLPVTFIASFILHSDRFLELSTDSFLKIFVFNGEMNVMYWGRFTNALLGATSILIIYIVGKKYFNTFVGLTAAFFLAFNYRHVLASHLALVDVPNDFFLLLVLLATYPLIAKITAKNSMLVGIAIGLFFSVKLSPFGLVAPGIVFIRNLNNFKKIVFWRNIFIFFCSVIITVGIVNIFLIMHFDKIFHIFEITQARYGAGIIEFLIFPYIYLFNTGITPLISILALIGVIWSFKNHPLKSLVLLLPVLLTFFSLTIYSGGGIYVRNFVTIIPIILIMAGCGCYFLYNICLKLFKSRALVLTICIILIAVLTSIYNSFILISNYSEKWNYLQVKDYIGQEFSNKKVMGTMWFLNSFFQDKPTVGKLDYDINKAFSLPELQEMEVDVLIADTDYNESHFVWWMARGKDLLYFKTPYDVLYTSFAGASLKELLAIRDVEFTKPWQAYESNFFIINIPKEEADFEKTIVYQEGFDSQDVWKSGGFLKKTASVSGIMRNSVDCSAACLVIDKKEIRQGFVNFTSQIIGVDPGYRYHLTGEVKLAGEGPEDSRDGVFKVNLYKTEDEARSGLSTDLVFVSARGTGIRDKWEKKEIVFDVPLGYRYMTIQAQADFKSKNKTFFDNIVLFKSENAYNINVKRKPINESIIFKNSML